DLAPKSVKKADGTDVWVYEGSEIPNIGLNAVAGRPPEEYNVDPTRYDDIRSGCYDIDERVKDMNRNGVLGSMCFTSFVQVRGHRPAVLRRAAQVPQPAVRPRRGQHRLASLLVGAHRLRVPAASLLAAPGLRRPATEPGGA